MNEEKVIDDNRSRIFEIFEQNKRDIRLLAATLVILQTIDTIFIIVLMSQL